MIVICESHSAKVIISTSAIAIFVKIMTLCFVDHVIGLPVQLKTSTKTKITLAKSGKAQNYCLTMMLAKQFSAMLCIKFK